MSTLENNLIKTISSFESVNSARHRFQSSIIKRTAKMVEGSEIFPRFIKYGFNLLNLVSDSNIEFETKFTQTIKEFIQDAGSERNSYNSRACDINYIKPIIKETIKNDDLLINISVPKSGQYFKIPFKLNNILDVNQNITILNSPLREVAGDAILIDQIQLEEEDVFLNPNEEREIVAILLVNENLKLHAQYQFDFYISGETTKQVSFMASIVP